MGRIQAIDPQDGSIRTLDGIVITWVKDWNPSVAYPLGYGVRYQGSSWMSLSDGNRGNVPAQGSLFWGLIAQGGLATQDTQAILVPEGLAIPATRATPGQATLPEPRATAGTQGIPGIAGTLAGPVTLATRGTADIQATRATQAQPTSL